MTMKADDLKYPLALCIFLSLVPALMSDLGS